MKLDYASIAVMIEHIKDEALKEGKSLKTVDELVSHLDGNEDGFINIIYRGK